MAERLLWVDCVSRRFRSACLNLSFAWAAELLTFAYIRNRPEAVAGQGQLPGIPPIVLLPQASKVGTPAPQCREAMARCGAQARAIA